MLHVTQCHLRAVRIVTVFYPVTLFSKSSAILYFSFLLMIFLIEYKEIWQRESNMNIEEHTLLLSLCTGIAKDHIVLVDGSVCQFSNMSQSLQHDSIFLKRVSTVQQFHPKRLKSWWVFGICAYAERGFSSFFPTWELSSSTPTQANTPVHSTSWLHSMSTLFHSTDATPLTQQHFTSPTI